MAKNSFSFDFKDFDNKLLKLTRDIIPERTEKGIGKACLQLLNDCVMQQPTVPIKEGFLRGSGSIFVDDKFVTASPHGKKGMANENLSGTQKVNKIVGVVGFNAPYASRLHEGEITRKISRRASVKSAITFSEPSAGPKFLESKMVKNRKLYFEIINTEIKGK